MIYNTLEKSVYTKSRYELITLLEEIEPAKENNHNDLYLFNVVANNYEQYIDICFPKIPLSEERLALFSHIYSNAGLIDPNLHQALTTNNRAPIWFVLCFSKNNKRCFYEAELFGLFDNPNLTRDQEIESIVSVFNSRYKNNQTCWQHISNSKYKTSLEETLKPINEFINGNGAENCIKEKYIRKYTAQENIANNR